MNFKSFLRTPFLQNASRQLLLSILTQNKIKPSLYNTETADEVRNTIYYFKKCTLTGWAMLFSTIIGFELDSKISNKIFSISHGKTDRGL